MTSSAFYGAPPVTEDDLWIIKGIYRLVGLTGKVDPKKGIPLKTKTPPIMYLKVGVIMPLEPLPLSSS